MRQIWTSTMTGKTLGMDNFGSDEDRSRLKHTSLDSSVTNPLILSHLSLIMMLLIKDTHDKFVHAQHQHVKAKL